jgi:hypothetical protein
MQARCQLGFERRVDAAIYRSALKTKVGSQSSERGIVATVKHRHPSSGCGIKRHVRFLGNPEPMEQYGKLASNGNDSLASGLLTASASKVKSPLSKRRILTVRSENMVRTLDQQTSEIGVTRMGDAELRIMLARLASHRSKP